MQKLLSFIAASLISSSSSFSMAATLQNSDAAEQTIESVTTAAATALISPKVLETITSNLQKEAQKEHFQGTVILSQNGTSLLTESFGFANKKAQKRNQLSTVSDIGSVAKTFTAAAIIELIAQHKLSLETQLGTLFEQVPKEKQAITIAQLLAHTSGLDNYHNETDFDDMDKQEAIAKIMALDMIALPGQKPKYSNAGYTLLAAIVEKVAEKDFKTWVKTQILQPLGLKNTGFYGDSHLAQADIAMGYGGDDAGQSTFAKPLTWALIGQGGMVASAEDLAKWWMAVRKHQVHPQLPENLMLKVANPKWKLGNIRYFSGWGSPSDYAGGSTDFGYTALLQYLPEYQLSILVLSNGYSERYQNATHQKVSKHLIFPALLGKK